MDAFNEDYVSDDDHGLSPPVKNYADQRIEENDSSENEDKSSSSVVTDPSGDNFGVRGGKNQPCFPPSQGQISSSNSFHTHGNGCHTVSENSKVSDSSTVFANNYLARSQTPLRDASPFRLRSVQPETKPPSQGQVTFIKSKVNVCVNYIQKLVTVSSSPNISVSLLIFFAISATVAMLGLRLHSLSSTLSEVNSSLSLLQSVQASQLDVIQKLRLKLESVEADVQSIYELVSKLPTLEDIQAQERQWSQPKPVEGSWRDNFELPTSFMEKWLPSSIASTVGSPSAVANPKTNLLTPDSATDVLTRWRMFIFTIKSEFPSQSDEFWYQLMAGVGSVLTDQVPPVPATVLIMFQPGSTGERAVCFARKVALGIQQAYRIESGKSVKEYDHQKFESMRSVSAIKDDIQFHLDNGSKVVVVKDIDQFQKLEHLMLFHAFCDNSDYGAVDTRAVFLFTLRAAEYAVKTEGWIHWEGNTLARQTLTSAWQQVLGDDKTGPLISRVAGYVVLFNDEDPCDE